MNYRELIQRLQPLYDEGEARAIIRMLLEERFHLSWTEVLCGGLNNLTENQCLDLKQRLKELEVGRPVQYVIGETEFCGLRFNVREGVLIPRTETEELIAQVPQLEGKHRVLDIGTGSGCIAITIAHQHLDWEVEAWDISDDALTIAQENAKKNGTENVNLVKRDVLDINHNSSLFACHFSLIISNPPYICNNEKAEMEKNVLDYEPSRALFVPDDDPLLFYRTITQFAKTALEKGGTLLFEINCKYGNEVLKLVNDYGFNDAKIIKDQFGNDRIIKTIL